jgi:hypothetical protein
LQDIFSLRRPKDFKAGLSSGAKSFGKGLVGGIVGLIAAPVVGATQDGFVGFAKGVATGGWQSRCAAASRPLPHLYHVCAVHRVDAMVLNSNTTLAQARRESAQRRARAQPTRDAMWRHVSAAAHAPAPAPWGPTSHHAPSPAPALTTAAAPRAGIAGAVILPVTGLSVGVVQACRGAINQPEAIAAASQGKIWDTVRRAEPHRPTYDRGSFHTRHRPAPQACARARAGRRARGGPAAALRAQLPPGERATCRAVQVSNPDPNLTCPQPCCC